MNLGTLIDEVKHCLEHDGQEKAFLVGHHDRSLAERNGGRNKDIWSLIGPITLGNNLPELELAGEDLAGVHKTLTQMAATNGSRSGSRYGQQLYLLVFSPGSGQEDGKAERGRDKDIWNLGGALPPESLVTRLCETHARTARNHDPSVDLSN